MKKIIKSILFLSLFLSFQIQTSCSKKENIIDLDTDYLNITDVLKYCNRECDEELDLIGESIKVKGYLKRSSYDNKFIYNQYNTKVVVFLIDIRNAKVITIQIMNDSTNISNKLDDIFNEMIYLKGKVSYGYDATSNKGCDKDLFIELFNADDIKIDLK